MAGKPKPMSQIKQLLKLHQEGESKKSIARILRISRNTVKGYLTKLSALSVDIEELLALDDPELEKQFHGGNPAYKDNRYEHLKLRLDYYVGELSKVGVTRNLLWEEYKVDYPNGYGRSQFFHHLSQHKKASTPTAILTHKPGEKLYVDFAGKKLSYVDEKTGEVIECSVFVACLPYSDYGFAMAVRNQSAEEFIYALQQCLQFLGGVPQILVPDNLKAAITKADRYEPDINQALDDFANHYGITVIPARAARPRDKALVENLVKLCYSRVYAKMRNMTSFGLTELNTKIAGLMLDSNQTRMQNKPWSREEKFLAEEKHFLKSLPSEPFEIKFYSTYKVQQNNHILLGKDKHYYSVPYTYIGQKAKVIYTRSMVRIYIDGCCVATHTRNRSPNGYSSVKDHLCSTHQHYMNRSPGYYIRRASECCEELHQLVRLLFDQKKLPEQLYKTCDGMFSLYRKTDAERFKKACRTAISNEVYTYQFLKNLIANKTADQPQEIPFKELPDHKNVRGQKYYS